MGGAGAGARRVVVLVTAVGATRVADERTGTSPARRRQRLTPRLNRLRARSVPQRPDAAEPCLPARVPPGKMLSFGAVGSPRTPQETIFPDTPADAFRSTPSNRQPHSHRNH